MRTYFKKFNVHNNVFRILFTEYLTLCCFKLLTNNIKMKSFVALCVLFVASVCVARPDDHYTDKYDNVNLDEILSNKRLLGPYIKCALDQGKCAPDAKELKDHIKDALETECSKCTDTQKDGTRRVIKHLINNEEESWNELAAKYDPDRKYAAKYEKELREVKGER
ncbi:allergen Tha p 1-like isoform X1 [Anticarsia gemmatalis]|uniref:allergen Tha p 1-like isoform X1 n=1 Tax=Anticarsia gemmatalis TaxID=129554 RepID=UPI003F75CD27